MNQSIPFVEDDHGIIGLPHANLEYNYNLNETGQFSKYPDLSDIVLNPVCPIIPSQLHDLVVNQIDEQDTFLVNQRSVIKVKE